MSILLEFVGATGVHHRIERDESDGRLIDHASYDCEAALDLCKAMATHNDGYSPSRELRRVAHIPDIVALKWLNEEGWWCHNPENMDRLKRKLNDPDWLYLRTAPGRV